MFKTYKPFLILSIILFFLLVLTIHFQKIKSNELQKELEKVLIQDLRIGAGSSKGKLGTAIFGLVINNGERTIKIVTMNVDFINEADEVSLKHKFFPVNNYSFSDASPLEPGQSKEFGFPIDEIIPEDWDGKIRSKIIDLKFKN